MRCLLLLLLAAPAFAEPDTDGDGLSDFQEIHKYFTDPAKADSDGDGTPDGDWGERREYSYTVRSIVQVMHPVTPDVLQDDYQDARILDETDTYVELEVIHYPLNTVADAITSNPDWRRDDVDMKEYLAPGPSSNWDAEMRAQLLAALRADGIDPDQLDDRQVVERVSAWLMKSTKFVDGFTTFYVHFPDGKPAVYPGLEKVVGRSGDALEEQWRHELLAKEMFENRTHGSCTSTAIFLNACLRALGIPTRIVYTIPVIDASDDGELELVRNRLTHHQVRRTVRAGVEKLGGTWAGHTFNEVYVGGRWRRLNYARLGQNTLGERCFGLLTHIATFNDWSEGGMASTVGLRQGSDRRDDVFGHANPYSTITLSDRIGVHARMTNDPVEEPDGFKTLTVVRALWWAERPAGLKLRLDDEDTAGHVLLKVKENRPDGGLEQYQPFYRKVGKEFLLRAEGQPDVRAHAARGYWTSAFFYMRIEPDELARMKPDVPYRLEAVNDDETYRWAVGDDVTLTRGKTAVPKPGEEFQTFTIDGLMWSDAAGAPFGDDFRKHGHLALLGRVREGGPWEKLKQFTAQADQRFLLVPEEGEPLELQSGTGGITTPDARYIVMRVLGAPLNGVKYTLRARNEKPPYRWEIAEGLAITR